MIVDFGSFRLHLQAVLLTLRSEHKSTSLRAATALMLMSLRRRKCTGLPTPRHISTSKQMGTRYPARTRALTRSPTALGTTIGHG